MLTDTNVSGFCVLTNTPLLHEGLIPPAAIQSPQIHCNTQQGSKCTWVADQTHSQVRQQLFPAAATVGCQARIMLQATVLCSVVCHSSDVVDLVLQVLEDLLVLASKLLVPAAQQQYSSSTAAAQQRDSSTGVDTSVSLTQLPCCSTSRAAATMLHASPVPPALRPAFRCPCQQHCCTVMP
jgi:hypothetical protein